MSAMSIGSTGSTSIWRSAPFNAMLPKPRRCVCWDQAIASNATYSTSGIPFAVSQWPTGITSNVDFVQCMLYPQSSSDAAALALSKYRVIWDNAASTIRIFNNARLISAEALTVTGSATTWTSSALTHKPEAILAVFNSTTQLTVMPAGATQVTGKVVPNYSTGVFITYDDTHSAGLAVDYTTSGELISGDTIGTAAYLRMMVWGY